MKRLLPNLKQVSIALSFFFFAAVSANAQTTWTGAVDLDWNKAGNWNPAAVPTAIDNVIIPQDAVVEVTGNATCNSLTINVGAIFLKSGLLTIDGDLTNSGEIFIQGGDLSVAATLINTGSFQQTAGEMIFASGSVTQYIPVLPYLNVTISGNGVKKLSNDLTIGGKLSLTRTLATSSNNLNTDGHKLTLLTNGKIIGEDNDHLIIGTVKKTVSINSSTPSSTFGDMGVGFISNGISDWGLVTVTRITGLAISNDPYASITRNWNISPTIPANTNVDLTLNWLTSEDNSSVNNFTTKKAQVWKQEGAGPWLPVGTAVMAPAASGVRSMTVSTTSFSNWAISAENSPLPVTWLYFNGKKTETGTDLTWATATEKNSEAFIVERSANGKNFEAIATVKAAGNSNQQVNYNFTDLQNNGAKTYYRLKQTDLDGTFAYSAIITVSGNDRFSNLLASVYPNPFSETLNLKLNAAAKEVVLKSLDGKEVYRKNITSAADLTLTGLPELSAGMYLLQIISDNGIATVKVNRQ